VQLAGDAADIFQRWRATRGPHPGALFVRLRRTGQPAGRLTASAMTNVVRQAIQTCGTVPLGPQDLRRTTIHELIDTGASLANAHRRFGFVGQVTLAARYDHRDFTDARGEPGSPSISPTRRVPVRPSPPFLRGYTHKPMPPRTSWMAPEQWARLKQGEGCGSVAICTWKSTSSVSSLPSWSAVMFGSRGTSTAVAGPS
jgi:hypothetical protein